MMYFKQFYLNCLAHASYLIGSDGAGTVVDPQRDVEQYVQEAEFPRIQNPNMLWKLICMPTL